MADMIDDKVVTEEWVSAHELAGLPEGSALDIQNKGPFTLLIMSRTAKPIDGSTSGFRMTVNKVWASSLNDVVWIRSEGGLVDACIQVGS